MEYACVRGGIKLVWDWKVGHCLYIETEFLVKLLYGENIAWNT